MKFKHTVVTASLIAAGALVAPFAAQAQDAGKPASPARVWVKDSVVTTKIKAHLAATQMSSLAKVHVETDADGYVQLTGKVASQAEKDRAETVARGVEGVKTVDNQLTVTGQ
jgi:hyperosmotically inducible protein